MKSRARLPNKPASPVADDGLALCCLEQAATAKTNVTRRLAGGLPYPIEVEGYVFSWGVLAERHEPGLLVWEFYLEHALGEFESRGRQASDLQALLLESLEALLDCVSRSFVVGCVGPLGLNAMPWVVVPGGLANGVLLGLVCKHLENRACRQWLCAEFIPRILPDSLEDATHRAFLAH